MLKVLYISYAAPSPTWGGAMAFYRHFFERNDFETLVATYRVAFPMDLVSYSPIFIAQNKILSRLCKTRLMPWIEGFFALGCGVRIPPDLENAARKFQPDVIFTIAGTWHVSALLAQKLATKFQVPLVASFNDWFNFGWFPAHPCFHAAIEKRFRRFYREADLALCTCEGMREGLGPHQNAHILYPSGAKMSNAAVSPMTIVSEDNRLVVVFAGSLSCWYGRMLERLVMEARSQNAPIDFRIYGSAPSWSPEFDTIAKREKFYLGHLPFEDLRNEVLKADALLLPMGFEADAALIERTSFKTKFLDYLTFGKPIFVWGPEACSAVRVAREFDSAEVCTSSSEREAVVGLTSLAKNPDRQIALVEKARAMYESRFHPDKIHAGLVEKIRSLVNQRP
jgi:glycosyltransferase involved in cell wall biosynthesis